MKITAPTCPWCLNKINPGQAATSHPVHRMGRAGRKSTVITSHAPGTCPPAKL